MAVFNNSKGPIPNDHFEKDIDLSKIKLSPESESFVARFIQEMKDKLKKRGE
jgi:hypothetical protein